MLFDVATGPSKGVVVYTFGASGRTDSSADATQTRHVTRERDGGWILEASFSLQALGLEEEGAEAAELSCDFLFVDRDLEDETALPSYHRLWTASRSRSDTSTFGVLALKD